MVEQTFIFRTKNVFVIVQHPFDIITETESAWEKQRQLNLIFILFSEIRNEMKFSESDVRVIAHVGVQHLVIKRKLLAKCLQRRRKKTIFHAAIFLCS